VGTWMLRRTCWTRARTPTRATRTATQRLCWRATGSSSRWWICCCATARTRARPRITVCFIPAGAPAMWQRRASCLSVCGLFVRSHLLRHGADRRGARAARARLRASKCSARLRAEIISAAARGRALAVRRCCRRVRRQHNRSRISVDAGARDPSCVWRYYRAARSNVRRRLRPAGAFL